MGTVGPVSNLYFEAWDIPFDFQPSEVSFLPQPWGLPFRDPQRAGLVLDAGQVLGLPIPLPLQPCFDTTGNVEPNLAANPDFSEAAETGFCPTPGLRRSSTRQGIYDRRDPSDVNQFGVRAGGIAPLGINFSLNYLYRRHLGTDIPGAAIAKFQTGAVLGNPFGFVNLTPHTTTDPITRETSPVLGYVRVPVEFYYPYVNVFGLSANYTTTSRAASSRSRAPTRRIFRSGRRTPTGAPPETPKSCSRPSASIGPRGSGRSTRERRSSSSVRST